MIIVNSFDDNWMALLYPVLFMVLLACGNHRDKNNPGFSVSLANGHDAV